MSQLTRGVVNTRVPGISISGDIFLQFRLKRTVMSGGHNKGSSHPKGRGRQGESKKDSEKRKRSGNTPSGLTPPFKNTPGSQDNHVKPAKPPVSDTSNGEASTSGKNLTPTSSEAVNKLENLSLIPGAGGNALHDANLLTEEEAERLLDSDDEDMDLDEEKEEAIAKDELGLTEKSEDKGKKSYANAAAKSELRGYEVLYIHSGVKDRSPIEEDEFFKLWDRMDFKTMDLMLEDETVPGDGVLWKKWTQGRGLICVKDKESSDFVKKLVSETKVKGKTFKAWHRGDFGEGRLVTGYLRGNAFKGRTGDQLMTLLVRCNKLAGKHTGVLMKDKDDGREFRFFANPVMWKDLVSRLPGKQPKLKLKLGLGMPMFKLSKEKGAPKASTGTSNQPSQPVAATSKGKAGETVSGKPEDMEVPDQGQPDDGQEKPGDGQVKPGDDQGSL